MFNITEEELNASKFQFFGISKQGTGIFPGATVSDFYNDPVIKKITAYAENLKNTQSEGVAEQNERYVLMKNGVEIKEGKLEPGMTFECVEQWRVLDDGRKIYDEDYVLFPLIEFVEFSY